MTFSNLALGQKIQKVKILKNMYNLTNKITPGDLDFEYF
jgi:hypothetical protein